MFNLSTAICVSGFVSASVGVWLIWGAGAACLSSGLVLFVAGGLASAREAR